MEFVIWPQNISEISIFWSVHQSQSHASKFHYSVFASTSTFYLPLGMLPLFDGLKSFSHFSSRTVYSRRRCLRDQTRTSLNVTRRLAFVEWWRIWLVKYPQWTVHKRWSKTRLDVRSWSNRCSLKSGNLLARGQARMTREQLGRVYSRANCFGFTTFVFGFLEAFTL